MGFETMCLAYLHSRKFTLQAKLEKCQAAPLEFEPSAYRADALTTALWCSSHPQQRKHDISPTCLHLLATHTSQVGLRPQTVVGSATSLVRLPSWRALPELYLNITFYFKCKCSYTIADYQKIMSKLCRRRVHNSSEIFTLRFAVITYRQKLQTEVRET